MWEPGEGVIEYNMSTVEAVLTQYTPGKPNDLAPKTDLPAMYNYSAVKATAVGFLTMRPQIRLVKVIALRD